MYLLSARYESGCCLSVKLDMQGTWASLNSLLGDMNGSPARFYTVRVACIEASSSMTSPAMSETHERQTKGCLNMAGA